MGRCENLIIKTVNKSKRTSTHHHHRHPPRSPLTWIWLQNKISSTLILILLLLPGLSCAFPLIDQLKRSYPQIRHNFQAHSSALSYPCIDELGVVHEDVCSRTITKGMTPSLQSNNATLEPLIKVHYQDVSRNKLSWLVFPKYLYSCSYSGRNLKRILLDTNDLTGFRRVLVLFNWNLIYWIIIVFRAAGMLLYIQVKV